MKNVFRILILITLGFNFYNAFIGDIVPRFSFNAWGNFKTGPFLTVLVSWLILETISHISDKRGELLPNYLWGFATFGLMLDSTSDYTMLFDKFRYYDKFLHFLVGGIVIGFMALKIIESFSGQSPLPTWQKYSLTILIVNFGGFLYEVFEFVTDKFFKAGNVLGKFDTTEDLILNTAGTIAVILTHYLLSKNQSLKPVTAK